MALLIYWTDILGVMVFAISGVLVASHKKMDPIGSLILGVITAIGGGTIRDIILDNGPIFWLVDSTDLVVALIISLLTMIFISYTAAIKYPGWLLPLLDAIGLAVFVSIGVNKAIACHTNEVVAVSMGVLTGIGGGILRDVLARKIPMVFKTDIYATACIIGAMVHVVGYKNLYLDLEISTLLGIITTLIIRLIAIKYKLALPSIAFKKDH